MSGIEALNKSLYRSIKSGKQYDKYFGKVSCKPTFLGEGVTTFGLQQMKHWATKYQYQTKQIAEVLKKKTLPETILTIKQFLYDHLQYSADSWDQNLRSPYCSWSSKKSDCKSYSIFASTILLNIGVKHSFRKITQPNSPDKWSHVYVVVNYNNKEYIIDGTVPYNYEVAKVKKEDLFMESKLNYYGLNAAFSNATVVNKKTYQIAEALEGFNAFLDSLEKKGVSKQITDTIFNEVRSYLEQGTEPKISLNQNFIIINGKRIDYNIGLNGLFDEILNAGGQAATGNISGAITGLFSGVFGAEDRSSVLAKATALVKIEADKALNIAQSQGIQAATSYLDGLISENRNLANNYKSANSKAKHNQMADDFTSFKTALINGVSSSNAFNPKSTTNQNINTGQSSTYPSNYNTGNPNFLTQNAQGDQTEGMSTTTKMAIGVGVLALVGGVAYVALKK